MGLLQQYSDDTREEYTSPPLSLADEIKLSKESYNLIIENIKTQLEMNEDQAKASLERLEDDLERIVEAYPSIESFDAELIPCVSEEDFKQRALQAYDLLIKWLRKIARWLNEAFDTLAIRIVVMKEQLAQLKIDAIQQRFRGRGTFTFTANVPAISMRYQPVKNVGELTAALSSLANHVDAYYAYMKTFTQSKAANVLSELASGSDDPERLVHALVDVSPLTLENSIKFEDAKDVENTRTSVPLLNNVRLLLQIPKSFNDLSDINTLELKVARAMTSSGKVPGKVTIPHFDRLTSNRCVEQMDRIVKLIEEGVTGAPRKTHRKVVNDIENMRARLQQDLRRNEEDGSIYQRIAATRTLVDWLTQPYRSLAVNSLRTVNGAYKLCRQNLRGSD